MRVIPVLDIQRGRAVHARRGERDRYAPVSSPLTPGVTGDAPALARAYATTLGFEEVYVADLDAIAGGALQRALVSSVAAAMRHTYVDAGVRSVESAGELLEAGATRAIVGLETLPSRSALRAVVEGVGAERTMFSLDLRAGEPVTRARDLAGLSPLALAELAAECGIQVLIVLDLARVGTGTGVDLPLVRTLCRALPHLEILAGGGIAGPDDLARLADAGAHGALVGSWLLKGGSSS